MAPRNRSLQSRHQHAATEEARPQRPVDRRDRQAIQRPPGLDDPAGKKAAPDGGFNPYDNSSTVRGNVGSNPYNSGAKPALKPGAPSPGETPATPRKPMDLKRLEEWMEIRKRVEQNRQAEDDDDE